MGEKEFLSVMMMIAARMGTIRINFGMHLL